MDLEDFFESHPVFTLQQLEQSIRPGDPRGRQALKLFLSRLCRKGSLGRIRRGLYYVVPPNETSEACRVDVQLVASLMAWDSVLAYTTALEHHLGLNAPATDRVFFLSDQKIRPTLFRDTLFTPCSFSDRLRRIGWETFGVEMDDQGLAIIRVTSPERSLVDILDRLSFCGGWRTLWPLLKQLHALDLDRIVEYLKLCDNPSTTVRTGWFLDKYGDNFDCSPLDYAHFYEHRPGQLRYLVPGERNGVLIHAWNLIVPRTLAD